MRGYPKHMAIKQDFENLLALPEFKARALADLQAIEDAGEPKVTQVVSGSEEGKGLVTKEIADPSPAWKRKGFKNLAEVSGMISNNIAEV